MSYGRFAAITSDLLARKGEARPWSMSTPHAEPRIEMPRPQMREPVHEIVHEPMRELVREAVHVSLREAMHEPLCEPPPVIAPAPVTALAGPPLAAAAGEPPAAPMVRKCTIRMSAHDYERLGIIAVKDDTTRQHLLQEALAHFLRAKERQYRAACQCMAASPGARCGACEAP